MKAKEMFKELGYEFVDEKRHFDWYITYKKPWSGTSVFFLKTSKTYNVYNLRGQAVVDVSIELHKAITQQMKELGWL
ncbi:MAG: hypothetical protein PHW40_05445 [Candidatus Izemoplasmatales bacterium]|nr:hypothetical protein [Candidatus Izemoplasmatales bacterium]